MKGFRLTPKELAELHIAHRNERNKIYFYRLHAIILLGTGYTLQKVKEVLFIDDETLRNYVDIYRNEGIEGLLTDNRGGKVCRLSASEIELLCSELSSTIHPTTASVVHFVKEHLGVVYSNTGMRDLLHRLNYVYKKPKLVPGNPDIEAQEFFAEEYENFMFSKLEDVEVVFLDAVHPEHNAMAAYGWIKRGEEKELKTNSGRQRLNLHGAINAETYEITIIESDTVNADSTIQLLSEIEQRYPGASVIKVILDNARYHYSKELKAYVATSRIDLVFLPSYSPNLNLIERVWKFFKKKVLYNTYYENVAVFRQACIAFFRNIDKYHDDIATLMTADFHLA